MLKLILDTNIYISALVFKGQTYSVFHKILKRQKLILSPTLIEEVKRVAMVKFGLDQTSADEFIQGIEPISLQILPSIEITICRDLKDNFYLHLLRNQKQTI